MREPITFFQEDLDDVKYPHDDVVVVSTMIGNAKVHRPLVTTGSSYEILFISAFIRDKPDEAGEPLAGFTRHSALIAGTIDLP